MSEVRPSAGVTFEATAPVLVVGAGAAGLVAALRAREAGVDALAIERDAIPRGSSALSAGLIPAAGTRFQRAAGIEDAPEALAADIMAKSHGEADPAAVRCVTGVIGQAVEWLSDRHGLPFTVIDNFAYPGHSAFRMHGLPSRSGAELMDRLRSAAEAAGVDILGNARVVALFADADGRVRGVEIARPGGGRERIGCDQLILACNGYGGDRNLVAAHIPDMAGALYFGHAGNQGDAVRWGEALGGAARHMSAYQGHGSVAHPHGILITWATITGGGFQVNLRGERFADESRGYSEQAADVVAQPEGLAVTVFDERIAAIARQFEDFRNAEAQGAIVGADDLDGIAARLRLPPDALAASARQVRACKQAGLTDEFGRVWREVAQLEAPYRAVKVTGALFHTQGGLLVDDNARILGRNGAALPNVFAAGGAACGVSGSRASGYLSGNGLLTAVAYGYLAGAAAASALSDT